VLSLALAGFLRLAWDVLDAGGAGFGFDRHY
jgi:hypothetical protein